MVLVKNIVFENDAYKNMYVFYNYHISLCHPPKKVNFLFILEGEDKDKKF